MCIWLILLFQCVCISVGSELKLSDSKLLLPYYSFSAANYTIVGHGSTCFEWWSGTTEVVTVSPIGKPGESCTKHASVTAVWQSPLRATSTIYARDAVTGHVLKCDVIVDDIHAIKIGTTTQELFLHNTPEALVVNGYDEFGNTFSSLDGIPFDWKIYSGTEKVFNTNSNGVLRFLSWTESEYVTPVRIGALEAQGMQGYMQLVSGLRSGSAIVSAALKESIYANVAPSKVRLLVIANAQLNPPVLFLMPHARATFSVRVVRHDTEENLSMPSKQYFLSVTDSEIVKLEPSTGSTIVALSHGQTTVTLLDKNVEDAISSLRSNIDESFDNDTLMIDHHRRPVSIVYVVEPAYFRFSIEPYRADQGSHFCSAASLSTLGQKSQSPWFLEIGKDYVISLEIYDQNNHRLFIAENQRISLKFPNESVKISHSSINGSFHVIRPLKTGKMMTKAKLMEAVDSTGQHIPLEHSITGTQEIVIHSPIKLLPEKVSIALHSLSYNSSVREAGYELKVLGGSGEYLWTVLDPTTLQRVTQSHSEAAFSLSNDGKILPHRFGSAVVVVSDLRNPNMCAHSYINITHVASLHFSTGRVEVFAAHQPLIPGGVRLENILKKRGVIGDISDLNQSSWEKNQSRIAMNYDEKESNSVLAIGLVALDSDGTALTDCHNIPFEINPSNPVLTVLPGFFPLPPSSNTEYKFASSVCAYFRVIGLRAGMTELSAFYSNLESPGSKIFDESRKVSALISLAVYSDISFLTAAHTVAVAIGSSRQIYHTGGPQPWIRDPSFHFVDLLVNPVPSTSSTAIPTFLTQSHPAILEANGKENPNTDSITPINAHAFSIRCEGAGSFELHVFVGNLASRTNPKPAVLSSSITIICEVATTLKLIPHIHLPVLPHNFPSCPFANRSSWRSDDVLPVSNSEPLKIELIFEGASGLQLTGVDSLSTVASLMVDSKEQYLPIELVTELQPEIHASRYYPEDKSFDRRKSNPFFFVTPLVLGKSNGRIDAKVIARHQWPGEQSTTLEASMKLELALPVKMEPFEDFQILNHERATSDIQLHHGSGFFHLTVLPIEVKTLSLSNSSTPCIDVHTQWPSHEPLEIDYSTISKHLVPQTKRLYWLSPRCRGSVLFTVTDLCFTVVSPKSSSRFDSPASDERKIAVVDLGSLLLYAPIKVELHNEVFVYVRSFGTDGKILPFRFARLLDLTLLTDSQESSSIRSSSILGLPKSPSIPDNGFWISEPSTNASDISGIAVFTVRGISLGVTKLKVMTSGLEKTSGDVYSNAINIHVFSPLRLEPCNLNLLLGASYELSVLGGPDSRRLEFMLSETLSDGAEELFVELTRVPAKDNNVIVQTRLGGTGTVTISASAFSSTGYADLDTSDFNFWNLSLPPESLSSNTSCRINVVALSSIHIGCPLAEATKLASDKSISERLLLASPKHADGSRTSGAPVWAEGTAAVTISRVTTSKVIQDHRSTSLVTPMTMVDLQPPLRFVWSLTPPMPNAPAELLHWLNDFNIEADEKTLSSGLVLIGISPGQVKLQLTVSTEDGVPTGQLVSLLDKGGHQKLTSVSQLSAELVVTILPYLSLIVPFRVNPRILLSPNSHLQIRLPSSITKESELRYSVDCPTSSNSSLMSLVRVSTSGFLESASGHCDTWSDWNPYDCRCRLLIDFHPSEFTSSFAGSTIAQSLSLDVIVKPPLYILATANKLKSSVLSRSSGLPFGGPYPISLSFHDALGDTFDSVSENLMSFRVEAHHSDMVNYFISPNDDPNFPHLGCLMLHLVPTSHTDSRKRQSATALHLHAASEEALIISSYLSLPTGDGLDIGGLSSLTVGQWACLPSLSLDNGYWSSSDSNIVYIEKKSMFLLPLRAGQVLLQFSLDDESAIIDKPTEYPAYGQSSRLTLLGQITVQNVCDTKSDKSSPSSLTITHVNAPELPYAERINKAELKSHIFTAEVIPIGLDYDQQWRLRVALGVAGDNLDKQSSSSYCTASLSSPSLRYLAEKAPFTCVARLKPGGLFRSIPKWLRTFLIAGHYSSESVSVPFSVLDSQNFVTLSSITDSYFTTHLEPSTHETGTWSCVVSVPISRSSAGMDTYSQLCTLPKNSKVIVEVTAPCGNSESTVLATKEFTLVPGFKVLLPTVQLGSLDLLITPRFNIGSILIYIPPATLAVMETSKQQLKARSQRPDILAIDSAPSPVSSVDELKVSFDRVLHTSPQFELISNITRLMENEAQISMDDALGNGLVWSFRVRGSPTKTAKDELVEIVVSLQVTGQHVSIPVRVQTRGLQSPISNEADEDELSSGVNFWSSLSWLHLIVLLVITWMLLIAAHVVTRTLNTSISSGTSSPQKPHPLSVSPVASPLLWTQGFGQPGTRLSSDPRRNLLRQYDVSSNFPTTNRSSDAFSPTGLNPHPYGDTVDPMQTRLRRLSPSRLREAFDTSL